MRGSCLCGKIGFEIDTTIHGLYQCHCSLCRKQGGSSSNSAAIIDADKFRWTAGQDYISSYVKQAGFRSDFCSDCGSPVPNLLRDTPFYWVPAGLLDVDVEIDVVAHLFLGSKAGWDTNLAKGVHYETTPDLKDLLALLRSQN